MGKYIIEIHDAFVEDCGVKKLLLPVKLNECGSYYLPTGITLTPYTEPDLDAIRKEAYEKGVQDTKQHWVDAPRTCAYKLGYENGLNDAWETARKIVFDKEDGGLDAVAYCETFGYGKGYGAVLKTFTASEAIERIRQYEQRQEEKEQEPITAEDVMRQYLDTFCKGRLCEGCPLDTPDYTCGRGRHFLTSRPVSNEEVRKAYAAVLAKMKEKNDNK